MTGRQPEAPKPGIFEIEGRQYVLTQDGLVYPLIPNVSIPDITSD